MAKEVEATATSMQIDVIYGPYAGGRVRVSVEEGKLAISEGWARAAYPPARAKPVEPTLNNPTDWTAAAEKAASRWQSEANPEPGEASGKAKQAAASAKAKAETTAGEVEAEETEVETEVETDAEAEETEETEVETEVEDEVEQDRSIEADTGGAAGTYQTRHRGGRPPKRKG